MSDVNNQNHTPVNSIDDILHTYAGAGDDMKTGVEVELSYFNPDSTDLAMMSPDQNKAAMDAVNALIDGNFTRNEPTSDVLEVASTACRFDNLKDVLRDIQHKIDTLSTEAAKLGLKRSFFSELPDKTAEELLDNLIGIPRYAAFWGPPRKDMWDIAVYFAVCKSNQVSVSYRDPAHMLDNIRRLYFLAPFLFMITDNSSLFNQGKRFSGHLGMHHRAALKSRGTVPPYIITAKNGDEYLRNHIDNVMNNPLFVYYDLEGELQRLPSGEWITFNQLKEKGLGTATNYFFAESILWPDVKIAALKDAQEQVYNHRYEARMLGVGIHQHQSAMMIITALAFDQNFADRVNNLLREFGFCPHEPTACAGRLYKAYDDARQHGGKFMDIAYGIRSMLEFGKKFADLLERAFDGRGFEKELEPITQICRTGCTDAKVNRILFPTLEDALAQQRDYDPAIFKDPNKNLAMIYDKELVASGHANCARRNAA